jgi:hypothetical protein
MKMIPTLAVVPEDALVTLEAVVGPLTEEIERSMRSNSTIGLTCMLNGWTPRMLAWGRLLAQFADLLDQDAFALVDPNEGDKD